MSELAIKVSGLGKSYQIGSQKIDSLRDTLLNQIKRPFRSRKTDFEEFWALRNIDFELERGKVLGVIGRNGAGKSTLLKLLSRITEPTEGRIEIEGRVSSLLEVGTGFHPELTGRENIFLNGTILGMSRKEVQRKFDEIVEFSGIAKFIETPVKRYSSGMYVRLAFAVAAHLEPEILIIDEVLAVGDVAFQKKSLGKMEDVAKSGRTILFVSHNMRAIRNLCNEAIFLQHGEMYYRGSVEQALTEYELSYRDFKFDENTLVNNAKNRRGIGTARYSSIFPTRPKNGNTFTQDEELNFELEFVVNEDIEELYASIALRSGVSRELVTSSRGKLPFKNLKKGERYSFHLSIKENGLRPGEYPLYFWLGDKNNTPFDVVDDVLPPLVVSSDLDLDELGYDPSVHNGYFSINADFEECKKQA